jgi:hypothetical protein
MMMRLLAGIVFSAVLAAAQTPAAKASTTKTPGNGPIVSFTATTDNAGGAHDSVRIDLLRWSTDAERDQLFTAWTQPGASATGGRGPAARGGRPAPAFDPFAAGNDDAAQAALARGAAGRGGRGGARDGDAGAAEAARPAPEASLRAALGAAPTVGYLWSTEVAGYSLRCAVKLTGQDASERIILITDRRLGAANDSWKPAGPATNYDFSLIELRLNSKGEGEAKISATGKVTADNAAKTIVLENYGSLPVVLKGVRRRTN